MGIYFSRARALAIKCRKETGKKKKREKSQRIRRERGGARKRVERRGAERRRRRKEGTEDIELKWPLGAHSSIPLSLPYSLHLSPSLARALALLRSLPPAAARRQQQQQHPPLDSAALPRPFISLAHSCEFPVAPRAPLREIQFSRCCSLPPPSIETTNARASRELRERARGRSGFSKCSPRRCGFRL